MREVELESKSAGQYAWFAARDAAFKSAVHSSHYSNKTKIKAERMKLVLEILYAGNVTINFCQKWVRVKVENARPRDKKLIKEWEDTWTQDGIEKVLTAQGVIYRVFEK